MPTPVRVRFAPSPTGYLHIGGARTALFNWLYARHTGGKFILRIEDTDKERSTDASKQAILDGLTWLGLDWDEGPGVGGPVGPYQQTERIELYRQYAEELRAKGRAYRCTCTKEELDARRKLVGQSYKYEGTCRDDKDPAGKPYVLRFRLPEDVAQRVQFDDRVVGKISKGVSDLYDEVLCRSDYVPLYDFGCVVDDHTMGITLAVRGQEHINSTFPQVLMYEALGWAPPEFAHLPLILGPDREKLSKRKHPEADVMRHKANGVLPEALLNYIVRLGWSHGNDEVMSRAQMVEWFDFDHVGSTSGVWDPQKLAWLNQKWLGAADNERLAALVQPFLAERGVTAPVDARTAKALGLAKERAKSLAELAEQTAYFFTRGAPAMDPKAAEKNLTPEAKPLLAAARELVAANGVDAPHDLEAKFRALAAEKGVGLGKLAQPVRVAVTGSTASPPLFDTLALLGKDEVLLRLDAALAKL